VLTDHTAITDRGRLRTAVQGPDGNLYLTTDIGGSGGSILRVVPT
jgi:glucose/arabinose dehydrogenase